MRHFLCILLLLSGLLPARAAQAAESATASATATATATVASTPSAASEPAPFGSNLFQGNFSQARAGDSREIGAGDRLVLRLWGGRAFDGVLTVDDAGQIELPEIGRAHV